GGAPFAFTLQPKLLSGRDAGGDLDGELAFLRDASGAAAGLARLGDDLPGPAALRTGPRHGEKTLLGSDLSLALALLACARARSGRRARAAAGLAVLLTRNLDRRLGAARRFLEADLEVVAQVGAALRPAAAAATAAEQIAEPEHVAEDVGEIAELREHGRVEAGGAARGGTDACMSEAVVQAALLG